MKTLREWFYHQKLKSQKLRAIYEIEKDLEYIRTFKKTMLEYDESKARKRMADLKQKTQRNDIEDQELDAVLQCIADSKAVKLEYQKSKALLVDLHNYISLL